MTTDLLWDCQPFDALPGHTVYALLQLRTEVFVMEQQCLFQDMDGLDLLGWHLLGWADDGRLAACARLLPAGVKAPEAVIGRVITAPWARGQGQGHALMSQALAHCERLWPGEPVTLHAQARLEAYYRRHGFRTVSEPYIEDGIPHVEMRRP
ncbi:GNAT family N-acetyltransferase [Roseateles cellulosilyticus]|uniref:GNAT family N-acetyltransferase n=1 Tax=Pelomonas cellulosilytica TaxID=2906762 RepID=A0ABS8XV79_9BURK|nr:GNAT family N-acetyltransferase [Pelomonas sp. P8]MCE4554624.1 GNAT family N-acetyltransferase [Pelomonas sp. P8]